MIRGIKAFFKLEAASGILLIMAAVLALIAANSPLNRGQ
jgi:Na+:H+ antiporter, NhaA family